MRRVNVRLGFAVAAALSTAPAMAQEPPAETTNSLFGVEEVVVTGTAVAERTKFESSVAISTFSSEDIAQQSPASSADLISAVPGFWVESTAGTTQGNVFARGIIQDGGYRYVGLMEDGIPIYPVFELSFFNPDQFVRVDETVDHVEALRVGPRAAVEALDDSPAVERCPRHSDRTRGRYRARSSSFCASPPAMLLE